MRVYRYWEDKLLQADDLIRAQLRSVMPPDALLNGALSTLQEKSRPRLRFPDVSALGRVVALDLESPWWIAWWRGRPSLESRRAELERVIRAEFEPLVDELAAAATTALGDHAQHAARQARIGTIDIVDSIRRRSSELVEQVQSIGGLDAPSTLRDLEQQRRQMEMNLARWSELRVGLSMLVEKCESLGDTSPSPRRAGQ